MKFWSPCPQEAQKAQWLEGHLLGQLFCILRFCPVLGCHGHLFCPAPRQARFPSSLLLCCPPSFSTMILFLESCSQVADSQSLHGVSGLHRNPNSFGCWGTFFKCDLASSGPYRLIWIFWNFKCQEPGPGQPLWNVINQMHFVASDRNPIQNYLRRKRVIFYWSELLKSQGQISSGFSLRRCLVLNEVDHLSPPTVSSAHPLRSQPHWLLPALGSQQNRRRTSPTQLIEKHSWG